MALGWASWGVGTFLATLEGWHVVTSPGWAVAERDEVQKRVWETRRTVDGWEAPNHHFPSSCRCIYIYNHTYIYIFGTRGIPNIGNRELGSKHIGNWKKRVWYTRWAPAPSY